MMSARFVFPCPAYLCLLAGLAIVALERPALAADAEATPGATTVPPSPPGPPTAQPVVATTAPATKKDDAPEEKPFTVGVFGFVRAGYENVQKDDRYAFVGRNSGFILDSARVGVEGGAAKYGVSYRLSIEAAAPESAGLNTPLGSLAVRLRDAYGRYDPFPFLGVQVGQFRAPFQGEELLSLRETMFASRSVGIEGVLVGRGIEQPGISLGRQLGIMLSPSKVIGAGGSAARGVDERPDATPSDAFGFNYGLMLMNGNGQDSLLDDNGRVGLVGRAEVLYGKYVSLGLAGFRNDRTVGTPPNLYTEEDTGMTGDVRVQVLGAELFGAATRLGTAFPTVGSQKRTQLAYNIQAGYHIAAPGFHLMPAYRYAYFHPWQGGAGSDFDSFRLGYHTFGVRFSHDKLPISAWVNYTLTTEPKPRDLDNNRFQLLGQLSF